MFTNVRIVLVHPTHPGNIGAVARAMKTMGFSQLFLVKPKLFPNPHATERAAHAADILLNATVVSEFLPAIQDCGLVIGASARARDVPWTVLSARDAAQKIAQESAVIPNIALVFGNEQNGLSNEELRHCHFQVEIPANPEYSSLNLAAAVQVMCYEMRVAYLNSLAHENSGPEKKHPPATTADLEYFYQHLEKVLFDIGFLKSTRSNKIMQRLRCLFNRTRLDRREMKILRGILTTIEESKV